ncbi:hypothetical protein HK102_000579, partial [Quaeritorhiza haematococci]
VNCPSKFVSTTPYLVVPNIDWVQTRYLLVRCDLDPYADLNGPLSPTALATVRITNVQYVDLNPCFKIKGIRIPKSTSPAVSTALPHYEEEEEETAGFESGLEDLEQEIGEEDGEEEGSRGSGSGRNGVVRMRSVEEVVVGVDEMDVDDEGQHTEIETDEEDDDEIDEDALVWESEDDFGGDVGKGKGKGKDNGISSGGVGYSSFSSSSSSASKSSATKGGKEEEEEVDISMLPPPEYATPSATKALFRELRNILKTQATMPEDVRGWVVDVDKISNLYQLSICGKRVGLGLRKEKAARLQWPVRLTHFDQKLPLTKDMKAKGMDKEGVSLEVRFSEDYPLAPPYIRVVKPRFLQFMYGGGGHVTAGGSICMDLLTMSGWSPAYNLEAVLVHVRTAISSTEPKPARLDTVRSWNEPYSPYEAIDAFVRVANQHGWQVPKWAKSRYMTE